MRSAVDRVHVVGVRINHFVIAFVVLNGDLADRRPFLRLEVKRFGEQRVVRAVQLFHKLFDAALVQKRVVLFFAFALVGQRDRKPLVEERQLL